MPLEHHSLLAEFPEFKDAIHTLKTEDGHFRRLFDEYHEIDKEVFRIESDETPTSDQVLEELKKKRLSLKDELFSILQNQ